MLLNHHQSQSTVKFLESLDVILCEDKDFTTYMLYTTLPEHLLSLNLSSSKQLDSILATELQVNKTIQTSQ